MQFVEFGMILSEEHGIAFLLQNVEHNDLVSPLFQPAARHVERLLRTDVPVASYGMAVHPYLPFAEGFHVEEGVAHLLQGERPLVIAAVAMDITGCVGQWLSGSDGLADGGIVVGNGANLHVTSWPSASACNVASRVIPL